MFSDAPEAVAAALEGRGFRLHDSQRRYRFGREVTEQIPGFELVVDDEELQVMVFPERGSSHSPLEPDRRQADAARVAFRRCMALLTAVRAAERTHDVVRQSMASAALL